MDIEIIKNNVAPSDGPVQLFDIGRMPCSNEGAEIIWKVFVLSRDEASLAPSYAPKAVHVLPCDVMSVNILIGRKIKVLVGVFLTDDRLAGMDS